MKIANPSDPGEPRDIHIDLEKRVEKLTRELTEAREQQAATAEVLKIISSSPAELESVLQVIVRSAAHFCEADDVTIFQLDGQDLRAVGLSVSRRNDASSSHCLAAPLLHGRSLRAHSSRCR
jgi:hypothetical protein